MSLSLASVGETVVVFGGATVFGIHVDSATVALDTGA